MPEKTAGRGRTTASPKPGGAKGSATSVKKARYSAPSSGTPKNNAAAKGALVAKDFPGHGLYIGEVIKVNARAKVTGGTTWKVLYEDQDMEDLDQQEFQTCAKAYDVLQDRFAAAQEKRVTSKDFAQAGLDVSDGDEQPNSLVGVRVRKLFPLYDEEFDGTVSKHFPPQEDDSHGNLWLIKYDDGDAEHMNSEELDEAKVLYKKHYGLVKKRVKFPANPGGKGSSTGATVTLYGEQIPGSRVFATIAGYRNYKKASTA
ncbi:conserved unknown protein [Ectocarpus siliculosus]|uniref:PTM/DIR17-like Tudor domain-containing protein n=1 Tax=Ectocarpus siliculosus TaxID=2880 RepID=D7FUE5_ECTSI|nr:conserved unknown protein [Ectocarpus siliculosus]|eukprot:CBJ26215.1 conserved unknown protein [Ectocarpus siliculosus]